MGLSVSNQSKSLSVNRYQIAICHNTKAHAKWLSASQFSEFLDHRMRKLRKSFCQDRVRSTTHRRAGWRFSFGISPP